MRGGENDAGDSEEVVKKDCHGIYLVRVRDGEEQYRCDEIDEPHAKEGGPKSGGPRAIQFDPE